MIFFVNIVIILFFLKNRHIVIIARFISKKRVETLIISVKNEQKPFWHGICNRKTSL